MKNENITSLLEEDVRYWSCKLWNYGITNKRNHEFEMMKSEKLKSILKGIWAFCSFVFVPRWGKSKSEV